MAEWILPVMNLEKVVGYSNHLRFKYEHEKTVQSTFGLVYRLG